MSTTLQPFLHNDLLLLPDDPGREYQTGVKEAKTVVKWGQRKLTLGLMQFMTYYWDPVMIANPVVVYVGAYPGYGIAFMAEMLPMVDFHLYDPEFSKSHHLLTANTNLKIHGGLIDGIFSERTAIRYAQDEFMGRTFLVSDVRRMESAFDPQRIGDKSALENEQEVWNDMLSQQEWHKKMKPVRSQLKFRLPWTVASEIGQYVEYLSGTVYKQPWVGPHSTETRLVPDVEQQPTVWDIINYQDQLFHFNTRIREPYGVPAGDIQRYDTFTNGRTGELRGDWDSAAEVKIIRDFLTKMMGEELATDQNVNKMSARITDYLNQASKLHRGSGKDKLLASERRTGGTKGEE